MSAPLQILPLAGIGEVLPGADLAAEIRSALVSAELRLQPFDVLVLAQKIVSKAENRFVRLAGVEPSDEALALAGRTRKDPRLVELVLRESSAVLRAKPQVLITRHHSGHTMANAGIDRSNVPDSHAQERVLLLPQDADASAARLHRALSPSLVAPEAPLGVVISDSFGRPWRLGVTNVAIGAAGLPSLVDRRGQTDRHGHVLEVTEVALADAVAAAAGLVMGEGAEGCPAVLVRGLHWEAPPRPAAALLRCAAEDLFQ